MLILGTVKFKPIKLCYDLRISCNTCNILTFHRKIPNFTLKILQIFSVCPSNLHLKQLHFIHNIKMQSNSVI